MVATLTISDDDREISNQDLLGISIAEENLDENNNGRISTESALRDTDPAITNNNPLDFFTRVRIDNAKRMFQSRQFSAVSQEGMISQVHQNERSKSQRNINYKDGTESMVSNAFLNSKDSDNTLL